MHSMRIPLLVVAFLSCAASAATFGTRDQLRECMNLDDALKERAQALEAGAVAINKQVADNEAEAGRLIDMKKTLDRSDKAAIQKFNDAALAHNQHVQQVDEAGNAAEAAAKAYSDDKTDKEQQCGSLTYRPADVDAVAKERKKTAAASAA